MLSQLQQNRNYIQWTNLFEQ